jgi:hypothetical protein
MYVVGGASPRDACTSQAMVLKATELSSAGTYIQHKELCSLHTRTANWHCHCKSYIYRDMYTF